MPGPQFPIVSNPNPYTGGTNGSGGGGTPLGAFGSGGPVPQPFFRDDLDFQRSMYRRVPSAEYPDGYLGTIRSRRDDRLLDRMKSRLNQRQYQRGVHKGERIDPGDYYWPEEFQPTTGLDVQATGMRFAPAQTLAERLAVTEQQMIARGSQSLQVMDPNRRAQLQRLAPNWR